MAVFILNPDGPDRMPVHLGESSVVIGAASDSDVQLTNNSLVEHHVRIEKKPDGFYLINLHGRPDVLVNGVEITFQRLNQGDQIDIADVTALVQLEDHEENQVREKYRSAQVRQNLNPASLSTVSVEPEWFLKNRVGSLPLVSFIAALTVVGAPVAFVLGFVALWIVRKRDGTRLDRSMAKWSIGLSALWMLAGMATAFWCVQQVKENELLDGAIGQEKIVIRTMKNLVCAQRYSHTIECFDADSDENAEYGTLTQLQEVKPSLLDTVLVDGEAYGYRFSIREPSESHFLVIAEPIVYGTTGLRTFSVNQTGQLCGKDLGGKYFDWVNSYLPILKNQKNACDDRDDVFAQNVLWHLTSLSARPEDQQKRQRILRRLREEYTLRSAEQKLDELYADLIYSEAKNALEKNELEMALAKLSEVTNRYSFYSNIAAVQRDVGVVRSEIARLQEQRATELFSQAKKLWEEGNPKKASEMFEQIETLYPATDVTKRIATLKPELQRQLRETDAKNIFSRLASCSVDREYEEILNLADQLHRNYSDTEQYVCVQVNLVALEKRACANLWRAKTLKEIRTGNIRVALTELESAEKKYPKLRSDLQDIYILLYRKLVDLLITENKSRDALDYLDRLSQLLEDSSTEESVDKNLIARLRRDVGLADYKLENYPEALKNLSSAAWKYAEDAEFNVQRGLACLHCGLYRQAETALNDALELDPNLSSALLSSAYLNLRVALMRAKIIASKLGVQDDQKSEHFFVPAPTDIDILLPFDQINNDLSSKLVSMIYKTVFIRDHYSDLIREGLAEVSLKTYESPEAEREAKGRAYKIARIEFSRFRNEKISELQKRRQRLLTESLKDFENREVLYDFIKSTDRKVRMGIEQLRKSEKNESSPTLLNTTIGKQCYSLRRAFADIEDQITALLKARKRCRKKLFDALDDVMNNKPVDGVTSVHAKIRAYKKDSGYHSIKKSGGKLSHSAGAMLNVSIDIDQIIRAADDLSDAAK